MGKMAENCANYLAKGKLVGIQGRIQTGSYTADDGSRRYTFEVVANNVEFLEWGNKEINLIIIVGMVEWKGFILQAVTIYHFKGVDNNAI